MKLLKQLNHNVATSPPNPLNEEGAGGAVGGGAVAGMAMPLFSTLVQRSKPVQHVAVQQPKPTKKSKKKKRLGLAEAYKSLSEQDEVTPSPDMNNSKTNQQHFDNSEVIARLKGLEKQEEVDHRDTVSFGLEDENGGVVRVSVKSEQAADFEKALQSILTDREEDTDEPPEIAEVLFKLKDHFDIIDVKWPEIVEDEEQQLDLDGTEGSPEETGEPTGMEGDMDLDVGVDSGVDNNNGQVTDLLQQVIDMMKADAEARKAEAHAREAEAKTKQADAIVAQTMSRVKQEEQYLDMETHQKAQKEQDREAKRLAQLAKWKHDMSQSSTTDTDISTPIVPNRDVAPEEEERSYRRPAPSAAQLPRRAATVRGRVAPHDIAQFIIGRVK